MAQGADLAAGDADVTHPEELDLRHGAAVELLDDVLRVRPLDLIAVEAARYRLAHWARRRTVVIGCLDIVAAGLGVEFDPVRRRIAADIDHAVFGEIEQDAVADDMAIGRDRRELLGLVDGEILERVGRQVRQQLDGVRSLDEQVDHVVRLVEQDAGIPPGSLFVAPIGEFRRDNRIDIGADLRVAQHRYDVA